MKETFVSNYSIEVLADASYPFSYKELYVSNYSLEALVDIYVPFIYKELFISNYTLEVLCSYIDVATTINTNYYFFSGNVLENSTPVVRQIIAYNQSTLLKEAHISSTISGSFLLPLSKNINYFLVCLDDTSGLSYNSLAIASIKPKHIPITNTIYDYGLSSINPGKSAYDIKLKNPKATYNGIYWIQPTGYVSPIQIYCDMITQGGGWTMCARWDRDFPIGRIPCLPVGALRNNINVADMVYTGTEGSTQTSTINIIPIIAAGATMFMHVNMGLFGTTWNNIYFSEIYQVVRDNPNNIFDITFDSNYVTNGGVIGSVVQGSEALKNRWFDYNMSLMSGIYAYYLNGGEGNAMFTNGGRPGAVYSTFTESDCRGLRDPVVVWGFYGKDSTFMDYSSGTPMVGTNMRTSDSPPIYRFNFMFIR
ncbi:hypothetical protein JZU46_05225 [bacterium]|nr:hypothetical protein [bacterium]